jgi:hypothetical protein
VAFLRKSQPSSDSTAADAIEVEAVDEPVGVGAGQSPKGRPTPKRRESGARPAGPVRKAPQTRKEAVQWQKAQKAAQTPAERKQARSKQMAAMRAGDPNAMPARDRGPVKALARDWVDSRRMMSNFLFVLLPLVLIGTAVPSLTVLPILSMVFLAVIILEGYFNGRHVRKVALQRFDTVKETTVSLGFYCASRASMPRRWRLPNPRVKLGDKI